MPRHLLPLLALTTLVAGAPVSASVMLSSAPPGLEPSCSHERAKPAAPVRSPAQKLKAVTTITLTDRVSEGSSLFHPLLRGFFAP